MDATRKEITPLQANADKSIMKIRDAHAMLTGDKTEHTMGSGALEIIDERGGTLFTVKKNKDGSIEVRAGSGGFHNGKLLHDRLEIIPDCSNTITIRRPEYPMPK